MSSFFFGDYIQGTDYSLKTKEALPQVVCDRASIHCLYCQSDRL